MRSITFLSLFLLFSTFVAGQSIRKTPGTNWYSETITDGIIIQNSFPKGGPYRGLTKKNFNYSNLVFFTRVVNETGSPFELTIHFSADSIAVPDSPDTFAKLFLPPDTMTMAKQTLLNFGITELECRQRLPHDESNNYFPVHIFVLVLRQSKGFNKKWTKEKQEL